MRAGHIALLLPDLEAGGAQRVLLGLAEAFVRRQHRVDLLVIADQGRLRDSLPEGVECVVLVPQRGRSGHFGLVVQATFRLAAWLRANRPDVLLSSVTGANLVAMAARRLAGLPPRLVLREAVTLANVRSRGRLAAMRLLYRSADLVITLSEPMSAEMCQRIGVDAARICCIPNGVDRRRLDDCAARPLDHPEFNELGRARIVAVGRLHAQKDYPTLIRAFRQFAAVHPAALFIVGEGTERKQLQSLIDSLGLAQSVFLVGFDPNPWRWMARADVFVLCSRWEGSPNVLLEALALAVPVVSTRFDASVVTLAERFGFCTVPCGDSVALACALSTQLTSPAPHCGEGVPDLEEVAERYLQCLLPGH